MTRPCKIYEVADLNDIRRQFRIARNLLLIILPIGVLGFMLIEELSLVDAIWLMIITLTTIGYGDLTAITELGKVFTISLVLVGLGAITFFLSSSFALLFSSEAMARRRRARILGNISELENHYIICGSGEMVDKTIGYVFQSAQIRHKQHQSAIYQPIEDIFKRLFGDVSRGRFLGFRRLVRRMFMFYVSNFVEHTTLLDLIVVVTEEVDYAEHLRSAGILVVDGDPTDDDTLLAAGVKRAQAIMVMLNQDAEGLLTVLTARNLNPALYITAATVEVELKRKMLRAGANSVLAPYEVAAQFLNSATLRPAVNYYFNSILFDQETNHQITQLDLGNDSPWIGKRISELKLRERYNAGIIGIRTEHADYVHAPGSSRVLEEGDLLLGVAPGLMIPKLKAECRQRGRDNSRFATFQRLVPARELKRMESTLDLAESEAAIESMSKHFIICGDDLVIQTAVRFLDPARPFVLLSIDATLTEEWRQRGFRVVHGNPASEDVLKRAGIQRAQAVMISINDKAVAVLTVLSARSISKSLLISVTATSDDMIEKLQRSGADRVVSPFRVAAQFVLLSTTRPEIAEFLQHVLYNEITGLETAELYMEDDSPWIGKTIVSLGLTTRFRAGVIGIRQANSTEFLYAPPLDYVIKPHEVLIIVTPMAYFDEMRAVATAHKDKRPTTLRVQLDGHASDGWSRDVIRELIKQHGDG